MRTVIHDEGVRFTTSQYYVLELFAGVPREVPDKVADEAIMHGAEDVTAKPKLAQSQAAANDDKVVEAIHKVVETGEPNRFTLEGIPKLNSVRKEAGVAVTKDMMDRAWAKYLVLHPDALSEILGNAKQENDILQEAVQRDIDAIQTELDIIE